MFQYVATVGTHEQNWSSKVKIYMINIRNLNDYKHFFHLNIIEFQHKRRAWLWMDETSAVQLYSN